MSLLGSILSPILLKGCRSNSLVSSLLSIARQFGTGVVVAVAFVHILLPAVAAFGSSCIPAHITEDYGAWPYAITGGAVIAMQFIELLSVTAQKALTSARKGVLPGAPAACVTGDACELQPITKKSAVLEEGHSHGSHGDGCAEEEHARSHIETFVDAIIAEFSLSLHSILVGITVGVVLDAELSVLVVALAFHQFFEGVTLGSRIEAAKFKLATAAALAFLFAASAPVGIAIGIGLVQANSAFATESNYILATGVLEAIAAGMLIHVGSGMLSKDLAADMRAHKGVAAQAALYTAIALGYTLMAVIGKWL